MIIDIELFWCCFGQWGFQQCLPGGRTGERAGKTFQSDMDSRIPSWIFAGKNHLAMLFLRVLAHMKPQVLCRTLLNAEFDISPFTLRRPRLASCCHIWSNKSWFQSRATCKQNYFIRIFTCGRIRWRVLKRLSLPFLAIQAFPVGVEVVTATANAAASCSGFLIRSVLVQLLAYFWRTVTLNFARKILWQIRNPNYSTSQWEGSFCKRIFNISRRMKMKHIFP